MRLYESCSTPSGGCVSKAGGLIDMGETVISGKTVQFVVTDTAVKFGNRAIARNAIAEIHLREKPSKVFVNVLVIKTTDGQRYSIKPASWSGKAKRADFEASHELKRARGF